MLDVQPKTTNQTTRPQQMPLTKGLPLVGSLPQLIKDPFGYLKLAHATYGNIYNLNLGVTKMVILNHPHHLQHVFVDNVQNYSKGGGLWDAMRGLMGNGLVVSEGSYWMRQRRMMQPQFHRQRLAALTELMVSAMNEAFETWEKSANGSNFNVAPAFNELTMKVLTRTLFGTGLVQDEMDKVSKALDYVVNYLLQAVVLSSLPSWLPLGQKEYENSVKQIDETVYRIIADGRKHQYARTQNHLMAMLLDMIDDETGDGLDDQQLRDEVITLFTAGFETTANALAWACDLLAHHPDEMEKLQAEVDAVLGDRLPNFDDLAKLPYSRMILLETLRLRPSAWLLPRTAIEDDRIDGYSIPAGATVVAMIYTCHYHADEWPDPEVFDPERFQPDKSEKRHKFAFMAFGAGQRMCIGKDFALMEGQLALAMMAQRYKFTRTSEALVKPQFSFTLRPKDGVVVKLEKRA
jgi:cytochrome P450